MKTFVVNNFQKWILMIALVSLSTVTVNGQDKPFPMLEDIDLATTSVKNQGRTGTCWAHATLSFLESEAMRLTNKKVDLSEMFIIYRAYEDHADKYMRFHGYLNFGPGSQAWDVMNVLENYGLVPEKAMPQKNGFGNLPNHTELDKGLTAFVEAIQQNRSSQFPASYWQEAVEGILEAYLGEAPSSFQWNGETRTPASFANQLGLAASNYVALTSFTHHPYHSRFVFESPDNWSQGLVYNLPFTGITELIDHALTQGYTVAWAADVSDKGFRHDLGLAIVPEKSWDYLSEDDKDKVWNNPVKQMEITAQMRQHHLENYATTDDHLMHIVGRATDENGTVYYKVKNSWGTQNPYGGYFYASAAYVQLKTMTLTVHNEVLEGYIK
ncbi:MAG: C1 family peptidase [Bacteroidota bacterium]|jgi:bleomycin hydrolase